MAKSPGDFEQCEDSGAVLVRHAANRRKWLVLCPFKAITADAARRRFSFSTTQNERKDNAGK
jgi:hypothetical protein